MQIRQVQEFAYLVILNKKKDKCKINKPVYAGFFIFKIGKDRDDGTPLKRLKRHKQFGNLGIFLPIDLKNLLEVIEELIKLNSKATDL